MLSIIRSHKLLYGAVAALVVVVAFLTWSTLLSNPNQPVLAGQEIVVTVTAGAVEDMYGYQFRMHYDPEELEYAGGLTSKIEEIGMIFPAEKEGYVSVGATMVGEQSGISGKNRTACEISFMAKKDGVLSDFDLNLSNVNVVKANQEYLEDLDGWNWKAKVKTE